MPQMLAHPAAESRIRWNCQEEITVVRLRCPHCLEKLRTRSNRLGHTIRCVSCRKLLRVPLRPNGWGEFVDPAFDVKKRHIDGSRFTFGRVTFLFSLDVAGFVAMGWILGHMFF